MKCSRRALVLFVATVQLVVKIFHIGRGVVDVYPTEQRCLYSMTIRSAMAVCFNYLEIYDDGFWRPAAPPPLTVILISDCNCTAIQFAPRQDATSDQNIMQVANIHAKERCLTNVCMTHNQRTK